MAKAKENTKSLGVFDNIVKMEFYISRNSNAKAFLNNFTEALTEYTIENNLPLIYASFKEKVNYNFDAVEFAFKEQYFDKKSIEVFMENIMKELKEKSTYSYFTKEDIEEDFPSIEIVKSLPLKKHIESLKP